MSLNLSLFLKFNVLHGMIHLLGVMNIVLTLKWDRWLEQLLHFLIQGHGMSNIYRNVSSKTSLTRSVYQLIIAPQVQCSPYHYSPARSYEHCSHPEVRLRAGNTSYTC